MIPDSPDNLRTDLCRQIAEEIRQRAQIALNLNQFSAQIVELIQRGLRFYFVSLFLIDSAKRKMVFQAGTGKPGEVLRKHGHAFDIESKGMGGTAVRLNSICIDNNSAALLGFWNIRLPSFMETGPIGPSEFFKREEPRPHPLLPDTKSQMVIPLRTPQGIIGMLDFHSSQEADFNHKDAIIFMKLADEVASGCSKWMK